MCNYTVFWKDGDSGTDPHGDVLIVVRNKLKPVVIPTTDENESIFVDLITNCGKLRVCCVYRAPSVPHDSLVSMTSLMRENLDISYNECLVGDLNFPEIN